MKTHTRHALAALGVAALLAPTTALGDSAATAAPAATSVVPAAAAPAGVAAAATRCKPGIRLPKGVDRRACGGLPKGAKPVRTVYRSAYSNTGIIKLPSGLTGCEFDKNGVGCGSMALISKPLRYGAFGDPMWWTELGTKGRGVWTLRGDAPLYEYNQPKPQVVPYDQVVYRGNFACLSAKNGATCWNTRTGHGFLIGSKRVATW